MRINPLNANSVKFCKLNNNLSRNYSTPFRKELSCDTVSFTGLFSKKGEDNTEVSAKSSSESLSIPKDFNANDMILSLKFADTLHRLDDKSIIVFGDARSLFFKAGVARHFQKEDSFLPNPKNIENVYLINREGTDPIIFAKGLDNEFILYGSAKNLTHPKKSYGGYSYNNNANWGDVLEFEDKLKLKVLKTGRESKLPMYDAKYSIDDFLADGKYVEGGAVLNKPNNDLNSPQIDAVSSFVTNTKETKYGKSIPKRTFDDVKGLDSTVEFIKKNVMFPIMHPEAFPDVKSKGVIFYGEPGTGKTLLSLAMIGEIKKRSDKDIHFINIDGKSLDRSEHGATEKLWRNVFNEAAQNQPAIIFIDEIDSVLETRQSGSNFVPNNALVSQFLTIMDDIEKNDMKIWVFGATNRPERIDPAIRRSGRIGKQVEIKRPDAKGCSQILDYYIANKNVNEDFNREAFSKTLYKNGCTGSDIADVVSSAREVMYDRCGIYEKMDNGTYKKSDLNNLEYVQSDFEIALDNHLQNKIKVDCK